MPADLDLQSACNRGDPLRRIERRVRRVRRERLPGVEARRPERKRTGADELAEGGEVRLEESGDVAKIESAMKEEDVGERDGDQNRDSGERSEVVGTTVERAQVLGIVASCTPFGNSAITRNSSAAPSKLVLCSSGSGCSCL